MKLLNQTIMTKLGSATLIGYILDNYERVDPNRRRPVIIFCPGGGFNHLSDREGEPLAVRMLTHGFQAFVLKYSLKPKCFPAALSELAESVKCLRDHAEELHIAPDAIFAAGASAGAHVAASLGVYAHSQLIRDLGYQPEDVEPNGMLLAYPVITAGKFAHTESIKALLGDKYNDQAARDQVSLERYADEHVCPTFIWTTATDTSVPPENALLFAEALQAHHCRYQLIVYPEGKHGSALGNRETAKPDGTYLASDILDWPERFADFARPIGHTFKNCEL